MAPLSGIVGCRGNGYGGDFAVCLGGWMWWCLGALCEVKTNEVFGFVDLCMGCGFCVNPCLV